MLDHRAAYGESREILGARVTFPGLATLGGESALRRSEKEKGVVTLHNREQLFRRQVLFDIWLSA